jgi:ABC-type Fe3+-hydroxamate transport system substrate-binding protein
VRVVSLVPSATETLLALGVPPIACTRFCDQPGIATVGGTKSPDVAAIVALAPDLVVVNNEENRREDADALAGAGVTLHDCSPRSVADVGPAVGALAGAVGATAPPGFDAAAWSDWVEARPRQVGARVLALVWRRPWMGLGADTYGASMLDAIGLTPAAPPASSERYPTYSVDELGALAPDLVVLPSEPYPFRDRHVAEVGRVLPDARVELVDGRDLFWWGTRTPEARARLAARLA